MTETQTATAKAPFTLKGWHVAVIFVTFFGCVIAVNTAMMMRAYATFPGEVSARPFEEGVAYNSELARHRAAMALGWKASFTSDRTADGANLTLAVLDADGKPVDGLKLTGAFARPTTAQGALNVTMIETGAGTYRAHVKADPGLWQLDLQSPAPGGRTFESESRVILK